MEKKRQGTLDLLVVTPLPGIVLESPCISARQIPTNLTRHPLASPLHRWGDRSKRSHPGGWTHPAHWLQSPRIPRHCRLPQLDAHFLLRTPAQQPPHLHPGGLAWGSYLFSIKGIRFKQGKFTVVDNVNTLNQRQPSQLRPCCHRELQAALWGNLKAWARECLRWAQSTGLPAFCFAVPRIPCPVAHQRTPWG